MSEYPQNIFTPRETENLPGEVYNENDKKTFYSEDFQNLGAEIKAIETELGTNLRGSYANLKERIALNKYNLIFSNQLEDVDYIETSQISFSELQEVVINFSFSADKENKFYLVINNEKSSAEYRFLNRELEYFDGLTYDNYSGNTDSQITLNQVPLAISNITLKICFAVFDEYVSGYLINWSGAGFDTGQFEKVVNFNGSAWFPYSNSSVFFAFSTSDRPGKMNVYVYRADAL